MLLVLLGVLIPSAVSQTPKNDSSPPAPYVLEIMYFKGRPLAYQRIESWAWYSLFERIPDWKPTAETPLARAVKFYSSLGDGAVKVRVTVLEGKQLENEYPVAEYTVPENTRIVVKELTKFGILPFELAVVRAPSTVSELPRVVNRTKSIEVSVEPKDSNLPAFKTVLFNRSSKAVSYLYLETTINGERHLSMWPHNSEGVVLIEPGEEFEQTVRYPLKNITSSTGETPEARSNLVLTVMSVVFADGTYEGDPFSAAQFRGSQLGEKIALSRILNVLRAKYDSTDDLAETISNLNISLDDAVFGKLLTEFQGLSDKEKAGVRIWGEGATRRTQKTFASEFTTQRQLSGISPVSLQTWAKSQIKRYQTWLDALP